MITEFFVAFYGSLWVLGRALKDKKASDKCKREVNDTLKKNAELKKILCNEKLLHELLDEIDVDEYMHHGTNSAFKKLSEHGYVPESNFNYGYVNPLSDFDKYCVNNVLEAHPDLRLIKVENRDTHAELTERDYRYIWENSGAEWETKKTICEVYKREVKE